MLSKKEQEKLKKDQEKEDSLDALSQIAKALTGGDDKLKPLIESLNNVVKAINDKKLPKSDNDKLVTELITRFKRIEESSAGRDKETLKQLGETIQKMLVVFSNSNEKIFGALKEVKESDSFKETAKELKLIRQQMIKDMESEHSMKITKRDKFGDVEEIHIKRIK